MPAARLLLAAAAVTSAALVLAACGADGSSVGPASTAQTLTPVTTAAAPVAPATTQAAPAPATTTRTQEESSSSSSSSSGSSAAPSSSVTTAGPVAQAPVGNSDCGSTAGGFVRKITTDADCATAVRVARGWVASIQSGKDPAGVITVRAGPSFACAARFNGNRAAVLCERGGDPKQPRVAFISQP